VKLGAKSDGAVEVILVCVRAQNKCRPDTRHG